MSRICYTVKDCSAGLMAVASLAGQVACMILDSGGSAAGTRLGLGWAKARSVGARVLCDAGLVVAPIRRKDRLLLSADTLNPDSGGQRRDGHQAGGLQRKAAGES